MSQQPEWRPQWPTEATIRAVMLARAREFSSLTGMGLSVISKLAARDTAFLPRVAKGKNFTVAKYQQVMSWFDQHWCDPQVSLDAMTAKSPVERSPYNHQQDLGADDEMMRRRRLASSRAQRAAAAALRELHGEHKQASEGGHDADKADERS
jgi:hypothetical protein